MPPGNAASFVHWYPNIFSYVPSTKVREIATMLKAIHAGEDIVAARQKAVQVPHLDRTVNLLVPIRHRRWQHSRAPRRLGDILDTAHRDPGQSEPRDSV
jgi:hypothetical protein